MSDTVAKLDARIARLVLELSDLRAQRNQTAAPLLRLPDEILVHIFLRAPIVNFDSSSTKQQGWIEKMGVCRRFRDLALQSPALWSHFELKQNDKSLRADVYSGQWLRLCNERGAQYPAVLCMNLGQRRVREGQRELYNGILELVPRVRTLEMISESSKHFKGYPTFFNGLMTQKWPMLMHMKLRGSTNDEELRVERTLLGGASTTLVSIHLGVWGSRAPWIYHELPQLLCLQDLTIDGLDLNDRNAQFCHQLSALSALVSVKLNFLPHSGSFKVVENESIAVPSLVNLRCVEFRGQAETLGYVLAHLPNPQDRLHIFPHYEHIREYRPSSKLNRWISAYFTAHYITSQTSETRRRLKIRSTPSLASDEEQIFQIYLNVKPVEQYDTLLDYGDHCRQSDLTAFIQYATIIQVEIEGDPQLEDTLRLIESTQPQLQDLIVGDWDSQTWPRIERCDALHDYVIARSQAGRPLSRLFVSPDFRIVGKELQRQMWKWQAEGHVGKIADIDGKEMEEPVRA